MYHLFVTVIWRKLVKLTLLPSYIYCITYYVQGAAKKVIPCRILQISKQPLTIF